MFKISRDIEDIGGYIINSRTGELFQLDEKGKLLIQKNIDLECNDENKDVFNFMLEKGVIVDDAYNPEKEVFHIQWHLLNACNLKCTHCYDWKEKTKLLSLKQMYKIVDDYMFFLKKIDRQGEISLTGGEPTLFKNLPELIEYIKNSDVYTSIFILSNGVDFKESLIEVLKKYDIGVQISLDGLKLEHDSIRGEGTFAKSVETIKQLLDAGIYTTIHSVLMKKNINNVESFIKEIDKLKVEQITFSNLVPIGPGSQEEMASKEEFKQCFGLIRDLNEKTHANLMAERPLWTLVGSPGVCPVGYKTLTIDTKGDIMPCRRLPMVIGNMLEDSLFKVWFKDPFLNKMRNREENIEKCGKCPKLNECSGCRAIAAAVTGNPLAADPNCWYEF